MKSIGLKLWIGMMGLIAFMLLLLWLFQIVFLENFYTNIRISEVRDSAKTILNLYESNPTDFKQNIEQFSYNNNLGVELLDSKSILIFIQTFTGSSPYGFI